MGEVGREMDASAMEDRGEEDKMFAALSCLTTMYQVLASAESAPEILAQLEKIVLPVIGFTMQQGVVEMYDDCFDLTDTLTFYQKRVSDDMWNIFRLMYTTFKHDGIDYLSEMLCTFDNIITYGSTVMEGNAELRHMVFDIFSTAMTSDQLGVSDQIAACKLADVFLLVLKTSIREAIPNLVPLCLAHINNRKAPALQKWAVLVILDALCFNTVDTLQVLEASQATAAFFAVSLQLLPKYTRVHDKKAFVSANPRTADKQIRRTAEKDQQRLHVPLVNRTVEEEAPPIIVAIVGPEGVGKTTLMRSLIRRFSKHTLSDIRGPVTVVSGKRRRLTFMECNNDINSMIDVGKVADLVLLMIDGSFGFEMETMEFLNILQSHGFPKIIGVLTHLDLIKKSATLRATKSDSSSGSGLKSTRVPSCSI
ncbi:hypothetical protein L7F22_007909 [Adiantum nelumboides]|nr:hypothetical protein [Adiantum nelumboides]